MKRSFGILAAVTLLVGVGAAVGGLGTAMSASGGNGNPQAVIAANPVLTLEQLSAIQPGLGTVMIEYDARFDNLWFAAQKSNWAMVRYQLKEMREIQEVAETTRPSRAPMLKAFEDKYLEGLDKARQAKKLKGFTAAYDDAIGGCNGCHAASSSSDSKSFSFVKITRPKAPMYKNVDLAGQ